MLPIWIEGSTRSGKTTRLVREFSQWVEKTLTEQKPEEEKGDLLHPLKSAVLVFAANGDNKWELANKLSTAVEGSYPVVCKTPFGFILEEVRLFWPLLFERLNIKAQFPVRLRPETEQELATRLWRSHLDKEEIGHRKSEYRLVRNILDLLQLAGASGIPAEDIPNILEQGLASSQWPSIWEKITDDKAQKIGELLLLWRRWCLERGLLSYGIIYELYWCYLLREKAYQHHLTRRYQAVFADDVDDYPAIAGDLFELLLDRGAYGVFTYNRDGQIRLGLNADPNYLAGLASRCRTEVLNYLPGSGLGVDGENSVLNLVLDPTYGAVLPESIQSIQTISRAEMLRKTAQVIVDGVKRGIVEPKDIAVIAPGVDEIARYTLMEILSHQGIPVEPLNEQRPLISSPTIRALLTLLTLIYPGLGRLIDKDGVAEMLVVLSRKPNESSLISEIDPVRAGLLADYCYVPDLEQPRLVVAESFPRWDRLGHRVTNAYCEIILWIEQAKSSQQEQNFPNPIFLLDRAIKQFLGNGRNFSYDRLSALREFMETAQHYWQVDRRIRQNEPISTSQIATIAQFIQLLRRGTITANPRPNRYLGDRFSDCGAVTLANIFQYRSRRSFHRWHFWLDAASSFWDKGGAACLFAYPLFLREWSGDEWKPEDEITADRERLQRILRDLVRRVGERLYLCHSDLGVNGSEQVGPLFSLVNASLPFIFDRAALR